jgi:hypothetical protein
VSPRQGWGVLEKSKIPCLCECRKNDCIKILFVVCVCASDPLYGPNLLYVRQTHCMAQICCMCVRPTVWPKFVVCASDPLYGPNLSCVRQTHCMAQICCVRVRPTVWPKFVVTFWSLKFHFIRHRTPTGRIEGVLCSLCGTNLVFIHNLNVLHCAVEFAIKARGQVLSNREGTQVSVVSFSPTANAQSVPKLHVALPASHAAPQSYQHFVTMLPPDTKCGPDAQLLPSAAHSNSALHVTLPYPLYSALTCFQAGFITRRAGTANLRNVRSSARPSPVVIRTVSVTAPPSPPPPPQYLFFNLFFILEASVH